MISEENIRLIDVEIEKNSVLKRKNHVLRAPNLRNIAPRELRRPDLGALEAFRKERNGQESSKKLPKSPRWTQDEPHDGTLAPETPPRDPQEHPRGAQEAPKRPPREPK